MENNAARFWKGVGNGLLDLAGTTNPYIAAGKIIYDIAKAGFSNAKAHYNSIDAAVGDYEQMISDRTASLQSAQDLVTGFASDMNIKYGSQFTGLLEQYARSLDRSSSGLSLMAGDSLTDSAGATIGKKARMLGSEYGAETQEYELGEMKEDADIIGTEGISSGLAGQMYSALFNGNTSFGTSLKLGLDQFKTILSDGFRNVNDNARQYSGQLSQYAEQMQQQSLSDKEAIGNAQATSAASGVRGTGTGSNASALQEFQADINKMAIASQMSRYVAQAKAGLDSLQKSVTQNAMSQFNSIRLAQKQAIEQYASSRNSTASQVAGYQRNANAYKEGADALSDEINGYAGKNFFQIVLGL